MSKTYRIEIRNAFHIDTDIDCQTHLSTLHNNTSHEVRIILMHLSLFVLQQLLHLNAKSLMAGSCSSINHRLLNHLFNLDKNPNKYSDR